MIHVLSDASGRHLEVSPTVAIAGRRPGPHPFVGVSLLKHRTGPNDLSTLSSCISFLTNRIEPATYRRIFRTRDDGPLPSDLTGSVHIENHIPRSKPILAASDPRPAQAICQNRLEKRERVEATASGGTSARNRLNADEEGRVSLDQNPARIARHGPITLKKSFNVSSPLIP